MIRRARLTDAAAIAAVHVASRRAAYAGIVAQDALDALSEDAYRTRWERALTGATRIPAIVLVATDASERIIGFASGGATRHEVPGYDGELYTLYLLPEAQGQGLGRRLFCAIATGLYGRGQRALCACVLADNPARGFYEHLGGAPLRTEPHTIGAADYPATWYGWPSLDPFIPSLRPVHSSDPAIFYEHQCDPEALRMAAVLPRERDAFMAHWARIIDAGADTMRTIVDAGEVAGYIVCWEQSGEWKVGYWLGRESWGRGIASVALSRFLEQVTMRPLFARVAKQNPASRRVLEKCGFEVTGEERFELREGEWAEEWVLRLGG